MCQFYKTIHHNNKKIITFGRWKICDDNPQKWIWIDHLKWAMVATNHMVDVEKSLRINNIHYKQKHSPWLNGKPEATNSFR